MQPLLSIVIPIYNNEMTLRKMVDSILMQKIDDWELLLINDGSTDSCAKIIDDYAKVDNRIQAFHKENGGTYSGFNFGLEKASGKYLIFAGADDTFEPTAFDIIKIQADEYEYDIIFIHCSVHGCDNEQNIIEPNISPYTVTFPIKIIGKQNVEKNWIEFMNLNLVSGPTNAYKSSIIKKYKFRENTHMADQFMNMLIADDLTSASCYPKSIYNSFIYTLIQNENVNIGLGKFHANDFELFNEQYVILKNLFVKWNISEIVPIIATSIIDNLQNLQLKIIYAFNNKNTPTQNIDLITGYYNDIIFECATISNQVANVDNVIFNEIIAIMQNNEISSNFDNPVVKMFTALNNTTISFDEIKSEITHSLLDYRNPYRIGFETYKTLSAKHTQIANADLIAYLETERTARQLLFTGNFEQALNKVIELFNSPYSTPEQYVTLALCGYNLGLLEDAKNAVETGLTNFPNYGRLENLLDVINAENVENIEKSQQTTVGS
ncbi:MAG: glycosyltransferase [Firmicutes bacterium]|nr:glycosyltransferase [Bacillota bacterium]